MTTEKNEFYLAFTEPVYLLSDNAISPDNMYVNLTGSKDEYIYKWRIVEEARNPLVTGRNISKFRLILQDV